MATKRLVHTAEGFLRYMQMSQSTLFAFVEGKQQDPFVFGMLCLSVCSGRHVTYQVCKASELPDESGGKTALLSFHAHLRRRKVLTSAFGGKTTHAVFFMDKDIDDILRRRRKCRHVVYTRHYDIQNDIFLNGRLLEATASAASLDPSVLTAFLSDGRGWCRQSAERWREWVVLCVTSACNRINHQCNYRVPSQVQCQNTGAPDAAKVAKLKTEMLAKSALDAATFERRYRSVERRVRRIYGSGGQDRIFKGKWYPALLDEDVFRRLGNSGYDRNGFVTRITATLATTLRSEDAWARDYRLALERILDN